MEVTGRWRGGYRRKSYEEIGCEKRTKQEKDVDTVVIMAAKLLS